MIKVIAALLAGLVMFLGTFMGRVVHNGQTDQLFAYAADVIKGKATESAISRFPELEEPIKALCELNRQIEAAERQVEGTGPSPVRKQARKRLTTLKAEYKQVTSAYRESAPSAAPSLEEVTRSQCR